MTKLRCITLDQGSLESNSYKTPKGNEYTFFKSCTTDVNDAEDAEFFLSCGGGKFFEKVGIVSKIKGSLKKKKDVAEEPTITEEKEEYKTVPVKTTKYTEKELFDMTKQEQTDLINKLSPEAKIPRLEKGRVELIMKLQTEVD